MKIDYKKFLHNKSIVAPPSGLVPGEISPQLFDFQRDAVGWGIRRGRAAFFEDCGLGKTPQQLEWANQIYKLTGENVIILAPLAVAEQTVREAVKFGIDHVNHCSESCEVKPGITITNYQKLHKFDASKFGGVALDESSILKSYDGAFRTTLIEEFKHTPYRTAWTATPSPNDFMELGNHAEFLGIMSRTEMLATFFIHDGGETSKWRLKGHAENDFWKWLCSWALNIRNPSDLGYDGSKFILPELEINHIVVDSDCHSAGFLFAMPASSLQERRAARRGSLSERVQKSIELANSNNEQWLVWCDLNDESEALTKGIKGAVEVTGKGDDDYKAKAMLGFSDGSNRVLVSKKSIAGFGMNWQNSHNQIHCGLNDSLEQFYQGLRRQYRFGQKEKVRAYVITSNLEGAVVQNIKRKQADADRMWSEMIKHTADISSVEIRGSSRESISYNPNQKINLPSWLTK